MPVRIRLQRHGRKGRAIYTIVAADSRARRDGRFIEKIGQYNPNVNPAAIDLDFEAALRWLNNGAVPSDTARAILSYKGVLMKKHLLDGVRKGALTPEQVEERFDKWMSEKEGKVTSKSDSLKKAKEEAAKARLEAEIAKNAEREAAAKAKLDAEAAAAQPVAEEASEEAAAEETSAE